jgi:hypothetical protein
MVCNFMNILHWIPGKSEKFPSPFPVPRRAPYGGTTSVPTIHSELQIMQVLYEYTYAMQCTTFVFELLCIRKVCYVQHISKKRNCYNGVKSTVTISNTPMLRSVFLNLYRMTHRLGCVHLNSHGTKAPTPVHCSH